MSPKAFRKARLRLGLTQKRLANKLHKSERQIKRYEAGEVIIPFLVEHAFNFLLKKS